MKSAFPWKNRYTDLMICIDIPDCQSKRQRCYQNIRQPNKLNYLKSQRTHVQAKAIAV